MSILQRQFLKLRAALAVVASASREAAAQAFQRAQSRLVVHLRAAGAADLLARTLSGRIGVSSGQPAIVENLGGAAGSIAVGRVDWAAPDGYKGNLAMHYALGHDDFEAVALRPRNNQVIIAGNASPANDRRELLAWLKSNSGNETRRAGPGSPSRIATADFHAAIGTRFELLSYRGTPPMRGRKRCSAGPPDHELPASSLSQVGAGKIKLSPLTPDQGSPQHRRQRSKRRSDLGGSREQRSRTGGRLSRPPISRPSDHA